VGSNPLYVIISIGLNDAGEAKDTAKNILASGEFVVNLVTEDFPSGQSELAAAHLHAAPSVHIKAPRVAEAQASLECKLFSSQPLGANTLFIGEVVMFHVADHLINSDLYINNFSPIGRLGSPSVYCRTTDRFDVARISYAQWLKNNQ
jgi:flavin reductase (DIM6/NTAB) family NADH-FMN oxidoreductase RutF